MGKVVVFGSLNQDLHLSMDRHPSTGETVMSGDIKYLFGGKGANQAVAAALAGSGSMFIGKVGDDPQGHEYVRRLGAFGVDTSEMEIVAGVPTGTAVIYNDSSGENMIVVAPGANHRMGLADVDRLEVLTSDDVLLMPLELPLDVVSAAVRRGHERGARVVLNLAPFAALDPQVLALCDPVVVNEYEARLVREAKIEVPSLLTTLGAAGAHWAELQVPAPAVTPVDTTGAGDSFCGTLAAALVLGADRETAMRRATEAAAACVLHHGAQPPLPE